MKSTLKQLEPLIPVLFQTGIVPFLHGSPAI